MSYHTTFPQTQFPTPLHQKPIFNRIWSWYIFLIQHFKKIYFNCTSNRRNRHIIIPSFKRIFRIVSNSVDYEKRPNYDSRKWNRQPIVQRTRMIKNIKQNKRYQSTQHIGDPKSSGCILSWEREVFDPLTHALIVE